MRGGGGGEFNRRGSRLIYVTTLSQDVDFMQMITKHVLKMTRKLTWLNKSKTLLLRILCFICEILA